MRILSSMGQVVEVGLSHGLIWLILLLSLTVMGVQTSCCILLPQCLSVHMVLCLGRQNSICSYFRGGAIERYEFFGVVGGLSPGVDPSLEHSAEVRSGDFNKDGLSDLFLRYYRGEDEGGFEWSYYLNNGGGFSGSEGKLFGSMNPKVPPIFVDYNSDGYLDVLWHDTDNNVIKASLWSKEENGFSGSLIDVVDTSGDTDHAHIFQDVNADGVVDYVRIEEDRVYTYLGCNRPVNPILNSSLQI